MDASMITAAAAAAAAAAVFFVVPAVKNAVSKETFDKVVERTRDAKAKKKLVVVDHNYSLSVDYYRIFSNNSIILIASDIRPQRMQGRSHISIAGGSVAFLPVRVTEEMARERIESSEAFAICIDKGDVTFLGKVSHTEVSTSQAEEILCRALDLGKIG